MMTDENFKLAITRLEDQIKAQLMVLAGGRGNAGNAFDLNNLLIAKENVQKLHAAIPKIDNPVDFTKDSEYIKIVEKKSKKK